MSYDLDMEPMIAKGSSIQSVSSDQRGYYGVIYNDAVNKTIYYKTRIVTINNE